MAAAQAEPVVPDSAVADVVASLKSQLHEQYPLAEIGEQYRRTIDEAWRHGSYRGLSACDLAGRLSADLQAVHRDRHLRIWCGGNAIRLSEPPHTLGHGFQSVTLDPELSIALIKTAGPWELDDPAFEAATHAMGLAAGAQYVVIDVRDNPGGHGEIGYFLASYFLPAGEAQPFERGLYRPPRKPDVASLLSYVPGSRLDNAKVYILVNANTASAAEGFAFGMQQLGRATIVGQTTAGAGIAGYGVDLGHGLAMFIPFKLVAAVNSDATYEGKGVVPELQTPPGEEYQAVIEAIRKERDALRGHDAPVLVKSAESAVEKSDEVLPDPTPNLENCQDKTLNDGAMSMTNRCKRAVTVQYMTGSHADVTYELSLEPGDRMEVRLPASTWWISAVCPEEYYSIIRLAADSREAVTKGNYLCTRHQP